MNSVEIYTRFTIKLFLMSLCVILTLLFSVIVYGDEIKKFNDNDMIGTNLEELPKNQGVPPSELDREKKSNADVNNVKHFSEPSPADEIVKLTIKENIEEYERQLLEHEKWRLLHIKEIYEQQKQITCLYGYGLLISFVLLLLALASSIGYSIYKGKMNNEWIEFSLKELKFSFKLNTLLLVLIIILIYTLHLYLNNMYPID